MSVIKGCSVVLTELCRICLKCKSEVMVDIFERSDYFKTESYKILKQCSNVMAHKNDKFPKYICWSCYVLLQNAWTLKTISEASYKILDSAKESQKKRSKRKDYKSNDFNKLTDAFICELEEINAEVQDSPQMPLLIPLHWNFVCLSCNKPFSSQRDFKSCPTTCDACLMTSKNLKASCNHQVSKSSSICLSKTTKESSIVNGSENKSNASQIGNNQNRGPLKRSQQIESEVLQNVDLKNHQDNMGAVSIHRNVKKRLSVKKNGGMRLLKQTFNNAKTQAKNPCICNICGASFSRIDSLRFHMEVHDDAIHTCDICYNTYLTSRALYGHKKCHTKLKCLYCFKNYHSQQGLNEHMKICWRKDNPVIKHKKIIRQKKKINYTNEISCPSKIARKKLKRPANSIESFKDNVSINVSAAKESSSKKKTLDWQKNYANEISCPSKIARKKLKRPANSIESLKDNVSINVSAAKESSPKKKTLDRQKVNYANEISCPSKIARKKLKRPANIIESLKDNVSINVSAAKESSPKKKTLDLQKINYGPSKIARKKQKRPANSIKSLKDSVSINVSATKESSTKKKSVDRQNDSQELQISNVAEEKGLVDQQPVLEINNARIMCEMCYEWFTNKQNLIAHVKDAHI